jgi:limonene-1,2-epoxide hydrolase
MATFSQTPQSVLDRLHVAMNQHDLEMFLECFDPDYHSEQPAHPDRQFDGRGQVRANWSRIFSGASDFRAELIRATVTGDVVWAEWDWQGTRTDGSLIHLCGVTIFEVSNNWIIWGRLYMEPVEISGAGIDANVEAIVDHRHA